MKKKKNKYFSNSNENYVKITNNSALRIQNYLYLDNHFCLVTTRGFFRKSTLSESYLLESATKRKVRRKRSMASCCSYMRIDRCVHPGARARATCVYVNVCVRADRERIASVYY